MSNTTQSHSVQFWNDQDVVDLIDELEQALDIMEPYYAQNNGGRSGYDLLQRLLVKKNALIPFTAMVEKPIACAICQATFRKSATKKNKLLTTQQQYSSALDHLLNVHHITDTAVKRASLIPAQQVLHTFKSRNEYDDYMAGGSVQF